MYALFGTVFTISKIALTTTLPLFFVGSRMLIAGLVMLAYQLWKNPRALIPSQLPVGTIAALAFFNIYLTNALEFWALQYLSSFKTCFLYSLAPFISALLAYFFLSEGMTKKRWIGLCIGFIGFLPVLMVNNGVEEVLPEAIAFLSWPEIAMVGAATSSVFGWILMKKVLQHPNTTPVIANGYAMTLGGLMGLSHSFLKEDGWAPFPVTDWTLFFETTLALVVISSLICYNLYGMLLKRYSATFLSLAGLTTPLFAALFGWFVLNEVVTWHFYLSIAVVFSGLLLYHQEEIAVVEVRP